jgi:Ca2+-binding RTX toxin-like protein
MPLPPIPGDINAAEPALRSELINYIECLIDAAQPIAVPGEGNDLILGTAAGETFNGLSGNDVIAGFAGIDTIAGGFGNDYVLGGLGADRIAGGDGNDFLFGEDGSDAIAGNDGDDALFGGNGNDTMTGSTGNDWMFGNAGTDRLNGGFGNDLLDGGAAGDTLAGAAGNDTLLGGTGLDTLTGGADHDFLEGGGAADSLAGGIGDDVYFYATRFHGNDSVIDFQSSQDRFEFAGAGFGVDPGTNLDDGTTFIANAAPVALVNEATVLYETDTGRLSFDIDGTGAQAAQLIATISGAPDVTNQDFIFV